MYFVFCRLYPFSPPIPTVCLLAVVSLRFTDTVSQLQACLSMRLERFRGLCGINSLMFKTQKSFIIESQEMWV